MSTFHYRNQPVSSRQIKHTRIENDTEFEQHYTYGEALGKGSFGTVTEAIRVGDDSKWAVKIVNKEKVILLFIFFIESYNNSFVNKHFVNFMELDLVKREQKYKNL